MSLQTDVAQLVACIPVPSWVWQHETLRMLAVNDAAVEEYGYAREEFLQLTLRDLRPADELERLEQMLAARPLPHSGRWRHKRKDGSVFDVDVRAIDLVVAGEPARLTTATDVSHREARLFLEEVEAVAQSGGFSYALDRSVARWSPQIFRMVGIDPSTPPSLDAFLTHVHPDDRGALAAAIARQLAGEATAPRDFRIVRPADGVTRWIRTQSRLIPADADAPARMVGVWRDVTDEHAMSEALHASEARFRAVVDSGMLGILEWEGARIVHANDACLHIIGYTRAELASGVDAGDLDLPALSSDRAVRPAAREYRRKDGSRVPLLVGAARLTSDGRRGVAFVVDESERRALQTRLAQADRMASMGAMAAAVAHELNNPLAYVVSNLTFLAESLAATLSESANKPAEIAAALSDARHGAERMREIVRDLSTFSRADELVIAPVDVDRAVENALNLAANELRHRARVEKNLTPLPPVRGNEARLTQALVNLLINAAQAMPEGGADRHRVTVTTGRDARGRVSIEVRDDGCGIAPDVLPRIFDPFFTTKPVGDGTGLGLSIVHRLVTSLGGEIEVESEPGRGATFRVLLEAVAEAVEPAPPARPTPPPVTRRRARVVILDDEPMVGAAIRRMLASEHDVTTLTRPQELFTLLDKESFDVLLCDLMMPLMTGMDVYAELQARFPSLIPRVVFLTGGAFTPRAKNFLAEVKNARMEKPFDAAKLRALIRSMAG